MPRIETVLKSGQPIIVQVTKDPMRAKGARLTAMVSLAGRHLVLVPNAKSIGVSRRLPDSERTRLRDIAHKIRPNDHGLIVRTAAEGANRGDLERDLERLLESVGRDQRQGGQARRPRRCSTRSPSSSSGSSATSSTESVRCVVDDRELESKLRDYIRSTTPNLDHRLELYEGELPIFEEFRVAEQIRKSLDRKVWLPSGGHIVIDRTEAMTVIDVNTGKFVGKSNLEETVFKTNKEAAVEVARQLRLRDIGGIIVIDFIDMEETVEPGRGDQALPQRARARPVADPGVRHLAAGSGPDDPQERLGRHRRGVLRPVPDLRGPGHPHPRRRRLSQAPETESWV